MIRIIISLFLLGLAFGSGPCLYSCGPVLISYIIARHKNIAASLLTYIVFSLSRVLAYVGLGIAVFFLGRFAVESRLGDFSKYIFWLGGGFIILLGITSIMGRDIQSGICRFLYAKGDNKNTIILGLIIGLLPCVPLLVMFSYIGFVSRSWAHSLIYSLSFGLGTIVSPLIIAAVAAGLIPDFIIRKKHSYGRVFSFICGLVMVFLGLYLIKRGF